MFSKEIVSYRIKFTFNTEYTRVHYSTYLIPPAKHTGVKTYHTRCDIESTANDDVLMVGARIIYRLIITCKLKQWAVNLVPHLLIGVRLCRVL